MRGIEVPPRTEDFTADPVELFFDLAYVFAFSQLIGRLLDDPGWAGVGEAALLFALLWLPWSQFTWSANTVSGNGRAVRLLFLVGTAVSVPMAASVSTALEAGGPVFALALGAIVLLGMATLALGVHGEGGEVFAALRRWVVPNTAALAVLVGGAFVDGTARVVWWLVALAVVFGAMVVAGRGEWIVRSGHFAERHGLIVIIALGEVVVAIGTPTVARLETGAGLPGPTVVALLAAGVFAGLLWWAYFDRPGPALEHRGEATAEGDRGRYVRDVYTWAHAPIVAGIILAAATLEEVTLHPDEPLPASFRAMLLGGLALSAAGVAAGVWRAFRAVARERLVAVAGLAVLLAAAGSWDGAVVLIVVDAVLALTLVVEHLRIER